MARVLTLRPDAKGRVTLGSLARGVSSFQATLEADGRITLEPFVEIPARERWLFGNEEALGAVRDGLRQASEGRIRSLGGFARYAKDDID